MPDLNRPQTSDSKTARLKRPGPTPPYAVVCTLEFPRPPEAGVRPSREPIVSFSAT